MTEVGEVYG